MKAVKITLALQSGNKQRGADGRKARVIDRPAILGGVFGVLKLILAPRSGDVGKGAFHRYQILSPKIGHETSCSITFLHHDE